MNLMKVLEVDKEFICMVGLQYEQDSLVECVDQTECESIMGRKKNE